MPAVETARGPVETADLGTTLMHEHVITAPLSIRLNWPHLFDAGREIAYARKTLDELCDASVRTIVDLTTFDIGRDVALLRQVAGTRMQIVVATGVHLQVPGFFRRHTPIRSWSCSCATSRTASRRPASRPGPSRSRLRRR